MFASASQFSPTEIPSYIRVRAEVRGAFERAGPTTKLIDAFETGGLRLKLPNSPAGCEAVVLNTAGGLAGGDGAHLAFTLGRKAHVCLTTQSAEKIYRADDKPAVVTTEFHAGEGARLVWMPQETILFNGSQLHRSLTIEVADSASVIAVESTVFGRVARGERLSNCLFRDRWRICRGGSLVFADNVQLEGEVSEILRKPAVGNGACAIATLVYVSSRAEKSLRSVRAILDGKPLDGGASAWNGMLVARLASSDAFHVRNTLAEILQRLSRAALPRVWSI